MTRRSYRVKFPGGVGFDLAGIVDEPQLSSTTGAVPVVVFNHCFTCNKDLKAVVRISRGLAELGVRVLRYDMTGLGGSDGDFSETSFTTNLADVRAAVAFAHDNLGPVTALVGHSLGGAAALAIAGQAASAAPSDPIASIRCVATLAAPSETHHLATLLASMNPAIESQGSGEVVIGGVRWTIRKPLLEDLRRHRLNDVISKICLPLMVFQSPQDTTVGFDHAMTILSLVQSMCGGHGSASLVTLEGADHLLSNPKDIVYVTSLLAAFVMRHAVDSIGGADAG